MCKIDGDDLDSDKNNDDNMRSSTSTIRTLQWWPPEVERPGPLKTGSTRVNRTLVTGDASLICFRPNRSVGSGDISIPSCEINNRSSCR